MHPGLTPKALRTMAGTEEKVARQLEVGKDPFHPLKGCRPPGYSCPHTPVLLLPRWYCQGDMMLPGHQ